MELDPWTGCKPYNQFKNWRLEGRVWKIIYSVHLIKNHCGYILQCFKLASKWRASAEAFWPILPTVPLYQPLRSLSEFCSSTGPSPRTSHQPGRNDRRPASSPFHRIVLSHKSPVNHFPCILENKIIFCWWFKQTKNAGCHFNTRMGSRIFQRIETCLLSLFIQKLFRSVRIAWTACSYQGNHKIRSPHLGPQKNVKIVLHSKA